MNFPARNILVCLEEFRIDFYAIDNMYKVGYCIGLASNAARNEAIYFFLIGYYNMFSKKVHARYFALLTIEE